MKIYVGCDHAGYELREIISSYLKEKGYDVEDCLMHDYDKEDFYSDAAYEVSDKVSNDKDSKGILICGTGIGMSIAANRNRNIRAALCHSTYEAQLTREHNNANVLCMGARVLEEDEAKNIVDTFLTTNFSNEERHVKRIERLS